MDIACYLKEEKNRVDAHLEALFRRPGRARSIASGLAEAMDYSLMAGGKRLRPILALSAFRACSGTGETVYRAACALELIHTYTLIHDDLPVMDNDDYRRGLPTCHRKFGVRKATLAGVGLLCLAFEELSQAADQLGLEPLLCARAVSAVAAAIGGGGVVGGQVVDLESEKKEVSDQTLHYIHTHKTGALIRVSCVLGGLLARADNDTLEALGAYGDSVGYAFQIVDDLLNVEGDFQALGKDTGTDQARGKATFPARYGVEASRRLAAESVDRAKLALHLAGLKDPVLPAIADFILARRS